MISSSAINPANLRRGILLWCASVLLWAAIEVLGGLAPIDYSAYQIVWMRYATHLLFMLLILGPRRRTRLVRTHHLKLQVARGLLMLGMPVAFIVAAGLMPVNDAWAVFWITPLLTMLLAALVLRERIHPALWIAALAGFAGTLIVEYPDRALLTPALLLPLVMALCFSLYLVMTRLLRDDGTLTNLFYTAACVLIPLSAGLPLFWRALTLPGLAIMAAIGLLGYVVLYLLDKAIEAAPVSVIAPFTYIQPIGVLVLIDLITHSAPAPLKILGVLIIAGGIACAIIWVVRPHAHSRTIATPTRG
ncbi:MAG TPA: DMT family transporter [Anaerolineae bacterium]|nr:DMT family transporter [Anaerolineae bacterium]